jgi:hypothetical protein
MSLPAARRLVRPFGLLVASILLVLALPASAAVEGQLYGKDLTGEDTIKISELLANADQHVGQTVRVEGLIVGVCAKRGCWMEIASDQELQSLRVKVEDGVIVFPLEAKGKHAVAEGILRKHDLDLEQTRMMKEHQCAENGERFDPESVKEPGVVYELEGLGARIR